MRITVFLWILLLPAAVFGLTINVAPILYIDETDQFGRNTAAVQSDLLSSLWAMETGISLQFNRLRDNRISPPQSLTDAVTVCRNEQIEYLLYGYLTRRTHSLQMEIRLFDYNNRQIMQSFFQMDDSSNYDRLIDDMALKIMIFIGDTFNIEIIPEKIVMTRISIPASLGYWTPIDRNWVDVMVGTAVIGSGFELIPRDTLFMFRGKSCYLSTGVDVKYRLGIGNPARYEVANHTFYFTLPLKLNLVLSNQHEISTGLGFVYFLEFFSMTEKYDISRDYVFSNIGFNFNLGYRFVLNDVYSLFFRSDFDFLINDNSLITFSPVVGVNIKVYSKEVRSKW